MGMFSPLTGAPSMISYLASVSLSFRAELPVPVCSRRRISISMCFSFIRTCAMRAALQKGLREGQKRHPDHAMC